MKEIYKLQIDLDILFDFCSNFWRQLIQIASLIQFKKLMNLNFHPDDEMSLKNLDMHKA